MTDPLNDDSKPLTRSPWFWLFVGGAGATLLFLLIGWLERLVG